MHFGTHNWFGGVAAFKIGFLCGKWWTKCHSAPTVTRQYPGLEQTLYLRGDRREPLEDGFTLSLTSIEVGFSKLQKKNKKTNAATAEGFKMSVTTENGFQRMEWVTEY
jgi:hypothetical protein